MGRSQMGALSMEVAMVADGGRGRRAVVTAPGLGRSGRWFLIACTLLLIEALVAAALRAQSPAAPKPAAGAAHTVQAGETLWSLAQRYLGNPRRWRDIAQANGLPMDAQRKLPVGRSLAIPGALKAADGTAAAAVDPAPSVAAASASTPADTGVSPLAGEPARDEASSRLFLRSARRYELGVREERDPTAPPRDGGTVRLEPMPRSGEALAAPFVVATSELARTPRLGERLALTATAQSTYDPLLRLRDRAAIQLPKGVTVRAGDHLVAVVEGDGLDKGRMVTPTGELVVEQSGRELVAYVVRQFGRLESGQRLLPARAEAPAPDAKAVAVSGSRVTGTVRRIDADPLLPTLQRYIILGGSTAWRVGDELELRTPSKSAGDGRGMLAKLTAMSAEDPLGATRPDMLVGRARVVRVTPLGATAVVTHHDQPRIGEGTVATLVARLP